MNRIRDFVLRHRRKFLVVGIVVGGSLVALKYAQRKFFDYQERQAREFIEKTRRVQHFESTERTCNEAILNMSCELIDAIIRECSTNDLLAQLQQNPPNKVELWEEMRTVVFTRLTGFVYATSMLSVALRVQLNVLGGYIYCISNPKNATSEQKLIISNDLKEQYLSLIKYFIHDGGLSHLLRVLRSKIMAVMKGISLNKCLSLADIEQLFWEIQMSINSDSYNDPCTKMFKYILPTKASEDTNGDDLLYKMFNETLDLLESEDAATVCSSNVCRGFSIVSDALSEEIHNAIHKKLHDNSVAASTSKSTIVNDKPNMLNLDNSMSIDNVVPNGSSSSNLNDDLSNINHVKMPLAKIIPIVNRLTASKGFSKNNKEISHNFITSLITFYAQCDKCKVLGANVYESFSACETVTA